jgi:hypothetical protein
LNVFGTEPAVEKIGVDEKDFHAVAGFSGSEVPVAWIPQAGYDLLIYIAAKGRLVKAKLGRHP